MPSLIPGLLQPGRMMGSRPSPSSPGHPSAQPLLHPAFPIRGSSVVATGSSKGEARVRLDVGTGRRERASPAVPTTAWPGP